VGAVAERVIGKLVRQPDVARLLEAEQAKLAVEPGSSLRVGLAV